MSANLDVTITKVTPTAIVTLNDVNVEEGSGVATIGATLNHTPDTDFIVTLSNGSTVTFGTDYVPGTIVESTEFNIQEDDVYIDDESYDVTITDTQGGGFKDLNTEDTATVTISDTITSVDVTVDAVATTPKVIDVTTATDGTTGVKVTAIGTYGETDLSIITGTNHDGFGVKSRNDSNGDTRELGMNEKIIVEFINDDGSTKDVNSLDVAFAWRNNHETAKITFIDDGNIVGYAEVTGDGQSTTKAFVTYFDASGNEIKQVEARGSSDKVDESFTFELPDSNGDIVSFDKVEFSAPTRVDDYLINKIVYTEVVDTTITDIETSEGQITFNIQVDENYPPQGDATAKVEINGKEYDVELNATGRGTVSININDLGDLSNVEVKVLGINGGNYEKVNISEKTFDFSSSLEDELSSTNDNISTNEDTAYTLEETDFGEYGDNIKEFKITELPENGKLFINVTTGDTVIDKDGNSYVVTEDSKVEIFENQILSLADVGAGKVVFEPNADTDEDGNFSFTVGDGEGNFSDDTYVTTIEVKAVADTPTTTISIDSANDSTIGSSTKIEDGDSINNIGTADSDIIEVNKELVMNDEIDLKEGNDTLILNEDINQVTLTLGEGNDTAIINGQINGTNNIDLGNGDDVIKINNVVTNNTHILGGDGKDTLYLSGDQSDYIINWQTNNNGMIEGSITDIVGGGTIQYNQMETIVFGDGNYLGTEPQTNSNEYNIDFSAALTDIDGSESLSIQISGVPNGATFNSSSIVEVGNGVWEIAVSDYEDAKSISDSIKMTVPEGTKNIDLTITATSTETRDEQDSTQVSDSDSIITSLSGSDVELIGDDTNIQTFEFGLENANSTVTVAFDASQFGGWDTSGSYKDKFTVEINGEEKVVTYNPDSLEYSFDVQADENGDVVVKFITNTTAENEGVEVDTLTATLIDGIVEGVEYETTSGVKGLTDSNGNFSYKEGDSVTFSVGNVVLGVVTAEELANGQVFLQDIANVDKTDLNDEYLENLATFLQSIDSDSGDNIVITQETRDSLVDSYINLQTATESEVKALIESIGKTYVDEESAMDHVQEMLEQYANIDASEFDEHIDDSIMTATFGIDAIAGITYTTSSGIEGITNENGQFSYDEGDVITFTNAAGQVIAQLDSSLIGSDSLITLSELGITVDDIVAISQENENPEIVEANVSETENEESSTDDSEQEEISTEEVKENEDSETITVSEMDEEDEENVNTESESEEEIVVEEEIEENEITEDSILIIEENESIDLSSIETNKEDTQENTNTNVQTPDLEELVVEDEEELKIFSEEESDKIALEGGENNWTSNGQEEIDGETFDSYQGTGATSNVKVLIDEDVSIESDI